MKRSRYRLAMTALALIGVIGAGLLTAAAVAASGQPHVGARNVPSTAAVESVPADGEAASPVPAAAPSSAGMAPARSWREDLIGTYAYRVIYVEDHSSNRWPVREATATWDKAVTALSIRYGACRPGAGCIRVYEGDQGDTGFVGWTTRTGRGAYMTGANITLNDHYPEPAKVHRQVACHEEGHALGLGLHAPGFDSCMFDGATRKASPYPNKADVEMINQRYED